MKFTRRMLLTTALFLTLIITGCKTEQNALQNLENNQATAKPLGSESAGLETIEAISYSSFTNVLSGSVTKATVRKAFGSPSFVNPRIYPEGELWHYDQVSQGYVHQREKQQEELDLNGLLSGSLDGQLLLQWNDLGDLTLASYHYVDSDKQVQSVFMMNQWESTSSSINNRLAKENNLRIGDTVQIYMPVDASHFPMESDNTVAYHATPGEEYQLVALTEHFAKLHIVLNDISWLYVWVPVWALTPDAAITQQDPELWQTSTDGTQVYWYPKDYAVAKQLSAGQRLLVVGKYQNWFAVIVEEADSEAGEAIVWIKDDDAHERLGLVNDLYKSTQVSHSMDFLERAAVYYYVREGVQKDILSELLGQPHAIERSENIRETGEKMETLERWRYESPSTVLLIDWTPLGSVDHIHFSNRDSNHPATKDQPWLWQSTGDLAHTSLAASSDKALIIWGDDGGFSGMHYDSNLYALDPVTGKKLWQRDLKYQWGHFTLSSDRRYAAIQLPPEDHYQTGLEYIEVLDTATGKSLWSLEYKLSEGTFEIAHQISRNTLALVYTTGKYDNLASYQSFIEVYALETGQKLWENQLEQYGRVITPIIANDQILIEYGPLDLYADMNNKVAAYDPKNGKEIWHVMGRLSPDDMFGDQDLKYQRSLANSNTNRIWISTANAWLLLNTKTGRELVSLPKIYGSSYEIINDQYAVRQLTQDSLLVDKESKITSEWLELPSGEVKWSIDGSLEQVVVVDGTIYAWSGASIQSLQLDDGSLNWRSQLIEGEYVPSNSPLQWFDGKLVAGIQSGFVVINPDDGGLLYRMSNTSNSNYDTIQPWQRHGLLTVWKDVLYLGSETGQFSAVKHLLP